MIFWVRRYGLIFGLAFFFFACEESGEIGLELDPERGTFVAKYAEIPLRASVIQIDSISTKNKQDLLVTRLEDQDFGKIVTRGYSQLFLDFFNLSIPGVDSAFYDSMIMDLNIRYLYGPSDGLPQTISIHELSDTVPSRSLFTFDTTSYFPDPIGGIEFSLTDFDTTRIDTTITIKLSDAFGQKIFDRAQIEQDIIDDNVAFRDFMNGIAFIPGAQNTQAVGLRLFNAPTEIRMHYHTLSDTAFYAFKFYDGRFNPVRAAYYHNMTLDKTGTALEGLTEPYMEYLPGDGQHYTHAGFGILSRISLTPIQDFLDTVGTIVINRAELEIGVDSYEDLFQPPQSAQYLLLDEDNFFIPTNIGPKGVFTGISKSEFVVAPFIRESNTTEGIFTGETSWFIGEIVKGISSDTTFSVFPAEYGATLNRFVGENDNVLLKIYYSDLQ